MQRNFGAGGPAVSAIGQGSWYSEQGDRREAIAAFRRGLDLGLGHIDTAEIYGDGRSEALIGEAESWARSLADGPWFAHGMTKTMLNQEWAMGIEELIESEAQAQAICMATGDFRRAFEAFAAKRKPEFQGD